MSSLPEPAGHEMSASTSSPSNIRHVVVFVAMLMSVLLYLDRFCVSFAADFIREDLSLTQTEMSWFLSAFFWSYALAQVPSGWLSDRYGARGMLVIYILSWSFFTGMIGASYSFLILLLTRLGCGLGQAGAYPTCGGLVSKWVPFSNRGFASSLIAFGGRVGGAIAPLLTAFLIVQFVPMSSPVELTAKDILNGTVLHEKLTTATTGEPETPVAQIQSRLDTTQVAQLDSRKDIKDELAGLLNPLLDQSDLYSEAAFGAISFNKETIASLKKINNEQPLESGELRRFNRFLLEATFPGEIGKLYVQGWRPVMYVYGLSGLLVAGLFWIFFRNRPEEHPWCNSAEISLIESGRPVGAPSPHGKAGTVPIVPLLKSRSMWFLCIAQVGTNIGWVFLVTWLPRYLLEVHRVPILERGVLAMTPLLVGFVGMLAGGWFTDRMTQRFGRRWGRRFPMLVTRFTAAMGYVLCLMFALSTDSVFYTPLAFTAAFSLVAFSTDMGSPATWAYNQDVGGRYVGSILGWGNMWGNLGAACSPPIYNYFLGENPALEDWNQMFIVCMVSFIFAGLCTLGVDATIPIAPPDEDEEEAEQVAETDSQESES